MLILQLVIGHGVVSEEKDIGTKQSDVFLGTASAVGLASSLTSREIQPNVKR